MIVSVNPASEEPLFSQVAAAIRADVAAGNLAPGDRLEPAREVAQALGINLHTVLRAYQDLRDEGLVDMRRGRGAVVTESAVALRALADDIRALTARAKNLGLSADTVASIVREAGK